MYLNLDHNSDENQKQNAVQQVKQQEGPEYSNTIQPYRTVSCCCNKLICDSHTLLRFQSYASSISFWSFLGIMYTVGFEYVVFSSCVFMLVNTIWNPLF